MNDYSKYQYGNLLNYIDEGCKRIGEERDFVQYILTMDKVESIGELIKRYNNIYKLIAVIFFGSHKLPARWYVPETWGYYKRYLVDDLNLCLNENIWKWFRRQENPTPEICKICVANLRNSDKMISVENGFLNEYVKKESVILTLLNVQSNHYNLMKRIQKEGLNNNNLKGEYIQYVQFLAVHGRIFDVAEISFGKDNGISYDNLIEDYKNRIEEEQKRIEKRNKIERKRQMRQEIDKGFKIFDTIGGSVFSFILSLPFSFLGAIFSNIGRKR